MHELRLLEMRVGLETAMNKYYDFKLGKYHLRGYGWPGLVALGILLIPLVVVTLAIPTNPAGISVLQEIKRLLGL
jgi:hypothetical protein